jgi:hypothetical protein
MTKVLLAETQGQHHSHQTSAYTDKEDKMLCEDWLHVGTDPICSATNKGWSFWKRFVLYFHEHRKFMPSNFEGDRNDTSLQKRWSFIQAECNRFCGAFEHVTRCKLSDHGVGELLRILPLVAINSTMGRLAYV